MEIHQDLSFCLAKFQEPLDLANIRGNVTGLVILAGGLEVLCKTTLAETIQTTLSGRQQ